MVSMGFAILGTLLDHSWREQSVQSYRPSARRFAEAILGTDDVRFPRSAKYVRHAPALLVVLE